MRVVRVTIRSGFNWGKRRIMEGELMNNILSLQFRPELDRFVQFAFDDAWTTFEEFLTKVEDYFRPEYIGHKFQVPYGDVEALARLFEADGVNAIVLKNFVRQNFLTFQNATQVLDRYREEFNTTGDDGLPPSNHETQMAALEHILVLFNVFGRESSEGLPDLDQLLSYFAPRIPTAPGVHATDVGVNSFSWKTRNEETEAESVLDCKSALSALGEILKSVPHYMIIFC